MSFNAVVKKLPENCGYLWPLQKASHAIPFQARPVLRGALCTHREFFLGKQLQLLGSQSSQSAEHKLALQKKMIKIRKGFAEDMRKVKSVKSLLERDKGDSQSQVCLLRKKLRGQLITLAGFYTKMRF